jgi:hypothetical protein
MLPPAGAWIAMGAALMTAVVAMNVVHRPTLDRLIFAALIAGNLALAALRWPRAAIAATMLMLPLLGLLRRLLIPVAGWSSYDPLLLVAPAVALLLVLRVAFEHRPSVADVQSRLMLALLALTVLEAANPQGGGIAAGATGLLFLAAPLLWFFVGRDLVDRRLLILLLGSLMVVDVAVSLYGLVQTQGGLPSWDQQWTEVTGYAALHVGSAVRAFGTFASAAEYASFLAIGLVLSVIWMSWGKPLALLAIPPLAVALFLESTRSAVVLCAVALVLVIAMRVASGRLAMVLAGVSLAAAVGATSLFGSSLASSAAESGNVLVAHQLGGLADPLNPDQSTLLLHAQLVVEGIGRGFQHPLGLGTAATNLAGDKFSGPVQGTEVDVSNAFVSLGLAGGLLYLAIMAVTLRRIVGLCQRSRDRLALAVLGVLIVTLGQWLNGGYYALSPLVWLLAGWASRAWLDSRPEPAASVAD